MTAPKPDDRSALVDPRVAAAWRESSSEEPAASVDAAILAAARREVGAGPEPIDAREARAERRRWWPLAAAATIAAVVVGVLQVTPTDELGAPAADTAVVSDMPTPATKPAQEGATSAPSSKEEKPARSDDAGARSEARPMEAPRPPAPSFAQPAPRPVAPPAASSAAPPAATPAEPFEPKRQISAAPPPASTPDPFPAAPRRADDAAPAASGLAASAPAPEPSPPRAEAAANASRERASIPPPDAPRAAGATQAQSRTAERAPEAPAALGKMSTGRAADSGADEARAKDRPPLPVPDWIALIRRLRAEGKLTEAAKELAAFRVAHADHERLLPPDLRDWRPPEKTN